MFNRKILILLFAACVLACSLLACGESTSTGPGSASGGGSTPAPTATPTHALKFTTTHTFSGSGIKKTGTFTVSDDWKLLWKCNPSSFSGGQYNLVVTVYGTDNVPVDVALNEICKAGNTSGETEEHQGGQVYLSIDSEASWALTVQELK